jgi:hypothetical protein
MAGMNTTTPETPDTTPEPVREPTMQREPAGPDLDTDHAAEMAASHAARIAVGIRVLAVRQRPSVSRRPQ